MLFWSDYIGELVSGQTRYMASGLTMHIVFQFNEYIIKFGDN